MYEGIKKFREVNLANTQWGTQVLFTRVTFGEYLEVTFCCESPSNPAEAVVRWPDGKFSSVALDALVYKPEKITTWLVLYKNHKASWYYREAEALACNDDELFDSVRKLEYWEA